MSRFKWHIHVQKTISNCIELRLTTRTCVAEKKTFVVATCILGYMKSVRILFHSTFLSVTAKTSTFVFFGGYVVILLQFHTSYQRLGPTKGRRERGRPFLHPYHLFCPVSHFISPLFPAEPSFFPTLGLWNHHFISFSVLKDAAIHFSCKLEWRS